ncbi:MAG: hypothetical protein ACE368_10265 [Paracoccaceae bacterium]
MFFSDILDRACPAATQAERRGQLPARIFVNPAVYDRIAEIRRDEIANGYPLLLLGMYLEADASLAETEFRLSA